MKRVISIVLCLTLIVALFGACSSSEKSIDFIYPFDGDIDSYDPQVASTNDEFLIDENCFEGLVRCDDDGNILPGCAKTWEVSDDGLTYTFHLIEGLKWYIYPSVAEKFGEDYDPEITANDFVFALQRGASDVTNAPLYSSISCIKNAPAVHSNKKPEKDLGVKAIDDYTLQITLSSPDSSFLSTLSTAIAMPCNEEFFNSTNGRYGLDLKYTLFNGQFVITNVLETSYILKDNSSYKGSSPTKVDELTLKITDDSSSTDVSDNVISGYYDAAYVRGYDSTKLSKKDDITLTPYSNTTWCLAINSESGVLEENNARHAIALALSDIDYDNATYLTKAKGFVPMSCVANGKNYVEASSNIVESYDSSKAVDLWKKAVKSSGVYDTELTILVPESMNDVAKELIQNLQSSIGEISNINEKGYSISIKIETDTEENVISRVNSGDYVVALCPFSSNSQNPVSFLENFSSINSEVTKSYDFPKLLDKASSASAKDLLSACNKCEKELLSSYCFVPVFYETNYYAEAKGVSGVEFHAGTGRVSFVYANRES